MSASRMGEQLGRVLSGRYRLVAPIGAGASARVYLGEDARLKRRVAVKLLHDGLSGDASFLRRFRAEAQAAAALSHPNIVAVFDWGEDDDGELRSPYLVTELLGGGSLRGVLDGGRRLTPSQALLVGLEACRALDHAHRRGFVHRDIKPANLLFGEDERLRIADFGLARALAEAAWTEPMGAVLGTARYASPEQARGESLDGRADVYALGLTLIEAVTGSVPFSSDTTLGTLMARVERDVVVPEAMGPLREPLERAGRRDPAERPTAADLAVALMAAAADLDRPTALPLVGLDADSSGARPDVDHTLLPPSAGDGGTPTVATPPPVAPPPTTTTTAVPDLPPPAGPPLTAPAGPVPRTQAVAWAGDDPAPTAEDRGADETRRQRRRRERAERGRRRRWPAVLVGVLLLAALATAGALGVVASRTPTHEVPRLEGLDLATATSLVAENDWELDVERTRRDGTRADQVLEQSPAVGVELEEGEVVALVVSDGPEIRQLPPPDQVVGRTEAEAIAAIEAAGLAVRADPERPFDEEVEEGIVLGYAPDAPPEAETGTPVGIVVSAGPSPRTVPEIGVGTPFADAAAAIEGVQLEVERVDDFSDDVAAGAVIDIDPSAGEQVGRGSTVTVTVSLGPDLVTVPGILGQSVPDATAALEAAGLVVDGVAGNPNGLVLFSDPPPGAEVRRGASVQLFTGFG